jgi:hypothetical protein
VDVATVVDVRHHTVIVAVVMMNMRMMAVGMVDVAVMTMMVMAMSSAGRRSEHTTQQQGSHGNRGVQERLHRILLRILVSQGAEQRAAATKERKRTGRAKISTNNSNSLIDNELQNIAAMARINRIGTIAINLIAPMSSL